MSLGHVFWCRVFVFCATGFVSQCVQLHGISQTGTDTLNRAWHTHGADTAIIIFSDGDETPTKFYTDIATNKRFPKDVCETSHPILIRDKNTKIFFAASHRAHQSHKNFCSASMTCVGRLHTSIRQTSVSFVTQNGITHTQQQTSRRFFRRSIFFLFSASSLFSSV